MDNKTITASKAREKFSALIDAIRVEDERVILTQYGRHVAALIPIDDLHLLEELEDRADLAEVRRRMSRRAGSITLDELETLDHEVPARKTKARKEKGRRFKRAR